MTKPGGRNVAVSVHHRLLLFAQQKKEEHQLVLMRYGVERLLFRLSARLR